jgi:hypothetical protein
MWRIRQSRPCCERCIVGARFKYAGSGLAKSQRSCNRKSDKAAILPSQSGSTTVGYIRLGVFLLPPRFSNPPTWPISAFLFGHASTIGSPFPQSSSGLMCFLPRRLQPPPPLARPCPSISSPTHPTTSYSITYEGAALPNPLPKLTSPVTKSVTLNILTVSNLTGLPSVTPAELAPIVAMQLNIVGDYGSTPGTVSYSATQSLTATNTEPSHTAFNGITAETSNMAYEHLPQSTNSGIMQSFQHKLRVPS